MALSVDELPAPVRELLEKEGRGFVQDTLELKYGHWTTCESELSEKTLER